MTLSFSIISNHIEFNKYRSTIDQTSDPSSILNNVTATMGKRPIVYITRQIPQKGLNTLLEKCNVCFWDSSDPAPRGELMKGVRGIDVLMCMPNDRIDMEVLNTAGKSLKIVATLSEDSEHIDVTQCKKRGIRIINIPKVAMETLTDMTVALLAMATVKWTNDGNLNTILQQKDIHNIKNDESYCVEISNRVLGIYGMSPLGISVGKALKEMGISEIIYHDAGPVVSVSEIDADYVTYDKLLEKSDIICVCSLTGTRSRTSTELFDHKAFKRMKKTAILIDITKDAVINYNDLYSALRSGQIEAAGLDVREYDVIPNRHPLASLENCYFLPFRECYKWDGRRDLSDVLAQTILGELSSMRRDGLA